jgi:hypothetical protein
MGRHPQAQPTTPLLDDLVRAGGVRLALSGALTLSTHELDLLDHELAALARHSDAFWRSHTPPPEAYSPVLPYPLGAQPNGQESHAQGAGSEGRECHPHHRKVWEGASLARTVLACLYEHSLTPAQLGAGRRLSARSLIDHLEGRSILHPDVASDWREACGSPISRGAEPPLFFSGGRVYRWPDLPNTLAGLQANLFYPTLLADGLASAMWMEDAFCHCWVTGRPGAGRGLVRSPPVHAKGTWPGARGMTAQELAASAFHPDFWRDVTVEQLIAWVELDPTATVERYLRWYGKHKRDGWVGSMKALAMTRTGRSN